MKPLSIVNIVRLILYIGLGVFLDHVKVFGLNCIIVLVFALAIEFCGCLSYSLRGDKP